LLLRRREVCVGLPGLHGKTLVFASCGHELLAKPRDLARAFLGFPALCQKLRLIILKRGRLPVHLLFDLPG